MSVLRRSIRLRHWWLVLAPLLLGCAGSPPTPAPAPSSAAAVAACPSLEPVYPAAEWQRIERSE